MLPTGDHTPEGFEPPRELEVERLLKSPIRRFGYPLYLFAVNVWLSKKLQYPDLKPDIWLWGQRGNDYARQRRRVNRFVPLTGKKILIAGCGTGRDVLSWAIYRPASLTGVDVFSYEKAWSILKYTCQRKFPRTRLDFVQSDLSALSGFADGVFDVVGSDAVFEHVRDLSAVLKEFRRVLRPGGIIYATFGPLWYCWGGDHISGFDDDLAGYNHLILESLVYERYLEGAGKYSHSEDDGRTWIKHGLFSYLRPLQYLDALQNAGFRRLFVGAIIEPKAVRCLRENPELKIRLLKKHSELDLIVTGMTVIYTKVGYA